MTIHDVLSLLQTIVMGLVTVAIALLKWGAKGGAVLADYQQLHLRVESEAAIQKDWRDRKGAEISDLATAVQGLPERLRGTFLTLEMSQRYVLESEQDRARLWAAITRNPRTRTREFD